MASNSYQVYVSFSGETGSKIENVGALTSDGTYLGTVLAGGGPFAELRGLAIDGSGRLYVANALKGGSAVEVFSATINPDGYSRDYLGTLLTPATTKALLHPYGLAFDDGALFVSSQDTNVVSHYAISGKKMPAAKNLGVAAYLEKLHPNGDYYGGTFVAAAQPVTAGKKTPPAVDPKDGGLSAIGFDSTIAEAIHTPAEETAADAAAAKKPARHSVRGMAFAGKRLYVADQAKDRVGIYGHRNGTFHGWIDNTGDASASPNALDKPVGLAVSPTDGRVYIGSPKNEAIFAYDPASAKLELVVSTATSGAADALKDLSGLAFTPDGTLLFGSRSQQQLYAFDVSASTVSPFGAKLDDAPECVLVVAV
jgi:outer membrane protein assembly factor BamB